MKKIFQILTIVILAAAVLSAQSEMEEAGGVLRKIDNKAFSVGEKLEFDLHFEIVHVGTAILEVAGVEPFAGRSAYRIESTARSNKVFSSFYKVEDKVTSLIDTEGIYSHKLEKHLREGSYKADRLFQLDHEKGIGIAGKDTTAIPRYCQDVLSSFYYLRTLDLKVGDKIDIPHFDNGKVYELTVHVIKKQKIRVPAGTFQTIVVEPKLTSEGLFKNEGKIKIFLTDDERKPK